MSELLQAEKKLVVGLHKDNEAFANQILKLIRENIANNDSIKDKTKFLQEKKKEIMEILQQHDLQMVKKFTQRLAKFTMTRQRKSSETESAQETRSHVHKIRKNFDRDDAYSVMKSKNLGLTDA